MGPTRDLAAGGPNPPLGGTTKIEGDRAMGFQKSGPPKPTRTTQPAPQAPPRKTTPPKPEPPAPVTLGGLMSRCLNWASLSQPDGTLAAIAQDAAGADLATKLLDALPIGSGVTGERLAKVRDVLGRV